MGRASASRKRPRLVVRCSSALALSTRTCDRKGASHGACQLKGKGQLQERDYKGRHASQNRVARMTREGQQGGCVREGQGLQVGGGHPRGGRAHTRLLGHQHHLVGAVAVKIRDDGRRQLLMRQRVLHVGISAERRDPRAVLKETEDC